MAKFKPKKFLLSVMIFTVLTAGVLATVSTHSGTGLTFDYPQLAIVKLIDETGKEVEVKVSDWGNPQIACWVRDVLLIQNEDGVFVDQSESNWLKTNPPAELNVIFREVGNIQLDLGAMMPQLQMKCSTSGGNALTPEDTFGEGALGEFGDSISPPEVIIPLVIEPSDFVVRVYASDKDDPSLYHDVYNAKVTGFSERIDSTTFDNGDGGLVEVMRQVVKASDYEKFLEDGEYNTNTIITIDGLIRMHFDCASQACTDWKYVIPLSTQRVWQGENSQDPYWGTNNWKGISNPIMVDRDFKIIKNVKGDETPVSPPVQCPEPDEYWVGGACVKVDPNTGKSCEEQGLVTFGNICVDPRSTTGGGNQGGNTSGTDIFSQLNTCLASGDPSCLTNTNFLPLWLGGIGFIFVIGALAQAPRREPEIYGVPYQ